MLSSEPILLDVSSLLDLSDDRVLLQLSAQNEHLRIETTPLHQLSILMATSDKTGKYNTKLTQQLANWSDIDELGTVYDSSTGFRMPKTGVVLSPDVSYILNERLEALEDTSSFKTIAPDFVIELKSESDRLKVLIDKMLSYLENGVRLGWLIDTTTEQIHIYRLGGETSLHTFDEKLTGEDVLPAFEFNPRSIFKKK